MANFPSSYLVNLSVKVAKIGKCCQQINVVKLLTPIGCLQWQVKTAHSSW